MFANVNFTVIFTKFRSYLFVSFPLKINIRNFFSPIFKLIKQAYLVRFFPLLNQYDARLFNREIISPVMKERVRGGGLYYKVLIINCNLG